MLEEVLQTPGEVLIQNLVLVSITQGKYVNLTDYLIELNIYESIFAPGVSGTLTLSDSRNLAEEFALLGEEYLIITVKTPSLDDKDAISKAFKVYGLEDKKYYNDGSTLVYQLNFASIETFNDVLNPIFKGFEGTPEELVARIYLDYMQADRNVALDTSELGKVKTPLVIFGESSNTIKFVSPGWTPVECINWIASKTFPKNNEPANYLFWETTKGFYFGNIGALFKNPAELSIGEYIYSQSFINSLTTDERHKSMYAIKNLSVSKSFDQLDNSMSGYLSNRIIDVDLYNKKFTNVDYDHGTEFSKYNHMDGTKSTPIFDPAIVRNALSYVDINFSYSKLHNDNPENFDVKYKNIFGNRRSNLVELDNLKMELVIPGRTDVEAGNIIQVRVPKKKGGALTEEDKTEYVDDLLYSGYYLITSLSHKINLKTHYITMDVTRNSFLSKEVQK